MYEPEDLGSNHFGSPASLRPTDNIEPYENIAMANEMIEPIEPIFEPSPPVFDIKEDWSQRSAKMLVLLKQSMKRSHTIGYNSLAKGKERKVVAGGFYELLVIANKGYIDLKQDRNFSDLKIVKTEKFTSVNL